MGNEIHIDYTSGETLYFVRHNQAGQVALSDGSSFENWGTGGHDADDYDVALVENGSAGGHYIGSFDAGGNIAAGRYSVQVFLQAGANPADGDELIGSDEMVWTGTSELTVIQRINADRVIDKSGSLWVLEYRDPDDKTVLFRQTMKNPDGVDITNEDNVLGRLEKE